VFKCYEDSPLFRFDLKRAIVQSAFSEVRPPTRNFEIHLSVEQTIDRIRALTGCIALDIEGGIPPNYPGVTCISVATSPSDAFIIRLKEFSPEDQARVMREFGLVLKSKFVTKILQNSLYDNFVLSWLWHCQINNVIWDTMLSGWEIYPELPKALGVQTSIWTEQPYYKFQRKIQDDETHYRYCCMDSCVTYEIALAHDKHFNLNLPKKSREHVNHTLQLLPAMLYMELKGIRYLRSEARAELTSVEAQLRELQQRIDSSLGQPLNALLFL
jgi:DNA polymerase I-like protein with 3'-5' exonuclease and polymerase domains